MDWKNLIKVLVPMVISLKYPKLGVLAPVISDGINSVEDLFGDKTGSQKLNSVLQLTHDATTGINAAAGKEVISTTAVDNDAAAAISLSVNIANLFHKVKL